MLKKIFFLLPLLHLTHCPCKLPSFFPAGALTVVPWYHEDQLSILNSLLKNAKVVIPAEFQLLEEPP